uniref:Nuclear speckle splicing regulatory protein 1 N-terminal domain-containing protein n=1 Tax=Clastoptera arizonana TaxID=38151 RepID=A0A1B6CM73_9HEMI
MASGNIGKQYGLLLPKKDKSDTIQRPAIFDEDSDSGGSAKGESDWMKKSYQREAKKSVEKRQTKIQMQQALSQDPTIYQYDEVYDDIKEKTLKQEIKKDEKKSSRYIQSLKKNAERRKLENERRQEKLIQKERLAEGEQFKDKEAFITSAYRKKLEEFNKMDEEERRMDYLEEIADVSKQKDLGGFYRHLYRSTVDKNEDKNIAELPESVQEEKVSTNKDNEKEISSYKAKRQYRKRQSGSSLEEGEADSDDSGSSSSSSSKEVTAEEEVSNEKGKKRNIEQDEIKLSKEDSERSKRLKIEDLENIQKTKEENKSKDTKGIKCDTNKESSEQKGESKPKVNIWVKRTVGAVFDDALRKFLERSGSRQEAF